MNKFKSVATRFVYGYIGVYLAYSYIKILAGEEPSRITAGIVYFALSMVYINWFINGTGRDK